MVARSLDSTPARSSQGRSESRHLVEGSQPFRKDDRQGRLVRPQSKGIPGLPDLA